MTILITGANGQVGRELASRAGISAVALTRQQLDITRDDAVLSALREFQPRVVINAAAYTAVDKAEKEPDIAMSINREGPAHLALACRELRIPLLHLSTDYVFDGKKPTPYLEEDPATPAGVYAVSKWEGEQHVRKVLPEHIILRVSWVFGAHGSNFVKTILRLARERPELRVVADQKGGPTPAGAIAEALLSLAKRVVQGEHLPWGTYHYAGTPATTWHGFATTIVDQAARLGLLVAKPVIHPITTAEYPLPTPRPANSILDCTNAVSALGLAQPDWHQGLREVLAALKQQNA